MNPNLLSAVRLATGDRPTGRTFRFREHSIIPNTEPDAEPWLYSMECAVCEKRGPEKESSGEAFVWALEHLKRAPEHLSYLEHISRPYRAVPGRWL